MAVGGFSVSPAPAAPPGVEFEAKITTTVVMSSVMAATGGLMFGYDIGVSGGLTSMDAFPRKFFPSVLKHDGSKQGNYCKYDNQGLQLFTSSLYLAGLTAALFASYTTRRLGRRRTMLMGGAFFIAGVIFNGAAQSLAMLIVGRILVGCGVGFANHAVPLFLSEIAPARVRGGFNILFQLNITVGILFANLVNCGTNSPLQDQAVGLEAFAVPRRHPGRAAHPRRAPRGGHAQQPRRAWPPRGGQGRAQEDSRCRRRGA
ncbi:unnamed protein product [Urochloa humidicola]